MPKNTEKTISNQQFKELFEDSDDDIDSTKDTYINFITDFGKWTIHHYYAIKCREKYPNMFFYYFPRSLFKISKIKDKEKSQIIDYRGHTIIKAGTEETTLYAELDLEEMKQYRQQMPILKDTKAQYKIMER